MESHREPGPRARRDQNRFHSDFATALAKEWAEYQKCFYDARNLKKDVLSRKYRPLATILRLVREWVAARKTRSADWNPIGAPRSHTRAKIAAALSI